MHPVYNRQLMCSGKQKGATLILSLLFMTILTLLSMTAMEHSVLSFKNQSSRLNIQRNIGELTQFQIQAAKRIKEYVDSRERGLHVENDSVSEGFLLLEEILTYGELDDDEANSELTNLLTYYLPDTQVDVYITQSRLNVRSLDRSLIQFNSYEQKTFADLDDQRYLYLQLHCIGKSKLSQNQGLFHVVADFRFEV